MSVQEFAQLVDAEKQARLDAEAHAHDMQHEADAARAWAANQVRSPGNQSCAERPSAGSLAT